MRTETSNRHRESYSQTVDSLMRLDLPSGVDIEIKL